MRTTSSAVIRIGAVAVVSLGAVLGAGPAHAARGSAGRPPMHARLQHLADAPALLPAGHSWTVTLLTGDVVRVRTVRGRPPVVTVTPGPHRGRVFFSKFVTTRGDIEVFPLDVAPLIGRVLDPELFNVTTLIRNGDDDAHRSFLPLIIQGRPIGSAALPGLVARGPVLSSIGAAATAEPRRSAVRVGGALAAMASAVTRARQASPLATGGIRYVWLDQTVRVDDAMPVRAFLRADELARQGAVLDPNLVQIGAPFAWRHGDTGAGIKVAVLDTGVDAAIPDLRGQIVAERNFTSSHPRVVTDVYGHGTFVASLIAGTGRAAGGERRGVAFGSRLVIGKVIGNQGYGLESWAIAGMQWAAARARVVNMSFSVGPFNGRGPLAQAVNHLTATRRVLFVAAAGNAGPSDETVGSPAAASAALAVGAVDGRDRLAAFSSRGPRPGDYAIKPEITAPGVNIIGARVPGTSLGLPIDARYTVDSGTSYSAPEVAGAAAILAAMHPGWSPARIKADLVSTAHPATGGDYYALGGGRLDIAAAVAGQVVSARAIADAGEASISGKAVRTSLTWASTASRATTITLTATLTDHFGHPVPASAFGLTTGQLQVPAHGTASADLIIRPRLLARHPGLFEGEIVARYAKATIRTPISFFLKPPTHTLIVKATPLPGASPQDTGAFAIVADLNEPDIEFTGVNAYPCCGVKDYPLHVPAGHYFIMGTITAGSGGSPVPQQTAVVGFPEVNVNHDTTVILNGAKAAPVTATVPGHPTIIDDAGIHIERAFAGLVDGMDVFWYGTPTTTSPLFVKLDGSAHIGSFRAYSWFRLSNPPSSTPNFVYDLYHRISPNDPASAQYVITPAERAGLARIAVRFYAIDGNTAPVADSRYGLTRAGFLAVQNVNAPVAGGSTRIDYLSGGPEIAWDQEAAPPIFYKGQDLSLSWVTEVPRFTSYVPGSRHVLDWVREPFVPGPYSGAPSVSFCAPLPTSRVRGYIYVDLVDLQDLPDGFDCLGGPFPQPFWALGTSRVMRLSLDGRLLGTTHSSFGRFTVPRRPGTYRLTYTTSIGQVLPVSTRTVTTWTFRSAAPAAAGQQVHIPLLLVRYHLPLNLDNRPDGSTAILTATRVGGTPRAKVTSLRLWTSLDGGATWQPAPVRALGDGRFAATLPHASAGQGVSLRVQASDAGGSKIFQTVIAAYHG
ncbi:MAG TPA: S8 family serine peptidase [Streptosporangiaceae bacterium]